jgi:hypothetical protein
VQRALSGILRRISSRRGLQVSGVFEAIPLVVLDECLAFHPVGGILRRRTVFPSYSWLGWNGRVSFSRISQWTDSRWIAFYYRKQGSPPSLVWANDGEGKAELARRRQALMDLPRHIWLRYKVASALPHEPTISHSDLLPDSIKFAYPLFQFWTVSITLTIASIDPFSGTAAVLDHDGRPCGETSLDGLEELPFFESENRRFEFVLLSRGWGHHDGLISRGPFSEEEWYNAIMIEWNWFIAERRGFARISRLSFDAGDLGGEWKEINLR